LNYAISPAHGGDSARSAHILRSIGFGVHQLGQTATSNAASICVAAATAWEAKLSSGIDSE